MSPRTVRTRGTFSPRASASSSRGSARARAWTSDLPASERTSSCSEPRASTKRFPADRRPVADHTGPPRPRSAAQAPRSRAPFGPCGIAVATRPVEAVRIRVEVGPDLVAQRFVEVTTRLPPTIAACEGAVDHQAGVGLPAVSRRWFGLLQIGQPGMVGSEAGERDGGQLASEFVVAAGRLDHLTDQPWRIGVHSQSSDSGGHADQLEGAVEAGLDQRCRVLHVRTLSEPCGQSGVLIRRRRLPHFVRLDSERLRVRVPTAERLEERHGFGNVVVRRHRLASASQNPITSPTRASPW